MSNLETLTLFIDSIRVLESCQMRSGLNAQVVHEFRDAMIEGEVFPPVEVLHDDEKGDYILVDGFTRVAGAKEGNFTRIDAKVVGQGNEQVAQLYALQANIHNSQRRTIADREKAISVALTHPGLRDATEEEIATATGTTRREVFRVRQKIGKVKNPERHRDHELESALKIIKADNEKLADEISVGIIKMPTEEIVRLAAKPDQERAALVPVMAERRLTLKQAEQMNLYIPKDESLPVKTFIDFHIRHPEHQDFYLRNHTVLLNITKLP